MSVSWVGNVMSTGSDCQQIPDGANRFPDVSQQIANNEPTEPTISRMLANTSFCPSLDLTIKSIDSIASVANKEAKIANKIYSESR